MKVSIIGTGNVAWHMVKILNEKGICIPELFARNKDKAEAIIREHQVFNIKIKSDPDFSDSPSGIFLLAVKDNAVSEVIHSIQLPEQAHLVHLSGALPIDVLKNSCKNHGVFYPLQTFTEGTPLSFDDFPIFIEANNPPTEKILFELAHKIGKNAQVATSKRRSILHLAAVFANNFTNHLLSVSKKILSEQDIPFSSLQALVSETIIKSFKTDPENTQTGPAIRGDQVTLQKHMDMLKEHPDWQELYKTLSILIQKNADRR